MNINEMTLAQIIERLAKLDEEVRAMTNVEDVENATNEKTKLIERKEELETLEQRKQTALGIVAGSVVGKTIERTGTEITSDNKYDTPEYRKAFANYVQRGAAIPIEYRLDANTLTTDVATVVPPIYVNRIIETMESTGMIMPLITRTNYAAGVNIPTTSVKPVATWVNEGAGSERQNQTTSYVQFTYFKLRCEISLSMEVGTMALSAFEAAFVRQVSKAMVEAIESKIVSTSVGTANPKGILAETPANGQALTAKTLTYDVLTKAEAALPQAYEGGAAWCMTKKTFMGFIGMTDAEGEPIARVNYGIGGVPERTLLGRNVVLCGDYLDSFSDALTNGKIFAFLFNFKDYVLNTVYDMGIQRKQDWDTEDLLTKAVMSCDGKVIDINSLVTIAKA